MALFRKEKNKYPKFPDGDYVPVLKCSICNGEQVAGFQDIHTGTFEEVMLIRDSEDLAEFRSLYGIEGTIEKIY